MINGIVQKIRCMLVNECVVCGLASDREYSICSHCEQCLPSFDRHCRSCGIDIDYTNNEIDCCSSCLHSPPVFDACRAAFPYLTPIDKLIANFKFSARFDIGYSLSKTLAQIFNSHYREASKPQLLIPVPLHASRLRSRGFNQAEEICKVLSRDCKVKANNSILRKQRNTEAQTSMKSASDREKNLRNAFSIKNEKMLESVTHIALVDDVVTTMATSGNIAKLLKSQQPCRVDVWCLARAMR